MKGRKGYAWSLSCFLGCGSLRPEGLGDIPEPHGFTLDPEQAGRRWTLSPGSHGHAPPGERGTAVSVFRAASFAHVCEDM